MIKHLFPDFLQNESVYREAERFWLDLWNGVDERTRHHYGWKTPWFDPLPPSISEGNPIFSAVSPSLRRAVRILQYEPTERGLEFFAYQDTFGGTALDPRAIHELVISCALSDVAADLSKTIMLTWIQGKPMLFHSMERAEIAPTFSVFESSISSFLTPAA